MMQPNQQAQYMVFLRAVVGNKKGDAEQALGRLRSLCDANPSWACLTTKNTQEDDKFSTAFTGKVHYECILAGIRDIDAQHSGLQRTARKELTGLVEKFKVTAQLQVLFIRC